MLFTIDRPRDWSQSIPPPLKAAELPVILLFSTEVNTFPLNPNIEMPPPNPVVELPLIVQFTITEFACPWVVKV